jgi:hypothetical protein
MRLDPRFALPAALAAIVIAIPAGSAIGDPPETGACPDGFQGPFPIGSATNKDKNGNEMVCVKNEDMNVVFKDDNCNPNCDKEDLTLEAMLGLVPEEAYTDDI